MKRSPLLDKLLKASTTKNAAIMSESVMFKDRDVIPTKIPIINAAFSGDLMGGISSGLTLLAGPSKSFKSLLSLVTVEAYLRKYDDAVAIVYDSEGGITPQYLTSMGVDPDRVIHIPIEHIEMLKFDLVSQLKELNRGDHVIIMIDSIGNTASLKELEDALNEKTVADMQRAKSIKSLFRMITPSLVAKDIPCVCVCHTYATMELYSKQIISGGCLLEGTEIIMADGSLKQIQDVLVGDLVLTLKGPKSVTNTWNPDTLFDGNPDCYRVRFTNGSEVVCSDEHRFAVGEYDAYEWIPVHQLHVGVTVLGSQLTRKIESIEFVGQQPVYDISVADVEHYVLANGVVSHNTGLIYSANQAFIIGKSQEKDGDELVGWNFTLNAEKSRFVKEKSKFTFTVLYDGGIDKYSGLLDLALEFGFVQKPKAGWYALVDMETGEIQGKNYRMKDTSTEEFLGVVLANKDFQEKVKRKYALPVGHQPTVTEPEDHDELDQDVME